jgi:hypothetical protein
MVLGIMVRGIEIENLDLVVMGGTLNSLKSLGPK